MRSSSSPAVRNIKHAQRESYFLREIVALIQRIAADDLLIQDLFVSRVSLSPSRGSCIVYLGLLSGKLETFDEKLRQLVLYKPSLRSSLAKISKSRTVPELFFKFDERLKKQQHMDELFNKLKNDGSL